MTAKTAKLPKRQKKVLTFIQRYMQQHGRPPTVREIGEGAEISSTSLVSYYLKRLEERGILTREPGVSRGIRLEQPFDVTMLTEDNETLSIPFLGYIVASEPIPVEPLPGTETVEVNRALLGRDAEKLFALKVEGDSMIDALVNDGDLILLRPQETVNNGEMAAVWIDSNGGEATLKKVYRDEGSPNVRLVPANPTMNPIHVPADDVQIKGKVVMVIRTLE